MKKIEQVAKKELAPKQTRRWREYIFISSTILLICAFITLAILAHLFPYFTIDLTITKAIQEFHAPWFKFLMEFISLFGTAPQSLIIDLAATAALFVAGLRWEATTALLSAGLAQEVGVLVKEIVNRSRPSHSIVDVLITVHDPSFPSGHVLSYTTFFGFLFFLSFTLIKDSKKRIVCLSIFGTLIGLVGISRIYLGAHWASDTLGAYLLGILLLIAIIKLYTWGKPRFFIHQPTAPPTKEEVKKI